MEIKFKIMDTYSDIVDFYGYYKNSDNTSTTHLSNIYDVDIDIVRSRVEIFKNADIIRSCIEKTPEIKISQIKFNKDIIYKCIPLLELVSPGSVKFNQLIDKKQKLSFIEKKKKVAINTLLSDGCNDSEISKLLKINIEDVYFSKKNLPANITVETDSLRIQKRIEEFFILYPYSTAKDASIVLGLTVREIKIIVGEMKKQGVLVKINNVPRILEAEEIKGRVLEIKKHNPGLSNKEISLELNISTAEVASAISEAVRIWQIEKSDSYDFYFNKTLEELNYAKEEAIKRHEDSTKSSSRWLEIFLMATEKQISMLGLKAPERININKNIKLSKDERDEMIKTYVDSEIIDVDFDLIEVTGERNE